MASDTKTLIATGVERFLGEVPALKQLKLVIRLELRGRGDIQTWRVELPGPAVTKDAAADARVEVSLPRSHFNELATEGKLRHWRDAYESGVVKVAGSEQYIKLVGNVIERQEERARTKKARH